MAGSGLTRSCSRPATRLTAPSAIRQSRVSRLLSWVVRIQQSLIEAMVWAGGDEMTKRQVVLLVVLCMTPGLLMILLVLGLAAYFW